MSENIKTFVTGHRNPDIDSLAAACALAELRRRQGAGEMIPVCPGVMSERAQYLFRKAGIPFPTARHDFYLRISHIMETQVPTLQEGTTLFDAVKILKESGMARLPVVDGSKFRGMLSPLNLLSHLLDIEHNSGSGLAGRMIHTSIEKIARVINAKQVRVTEGNTEQDFRVYVAAMSSTSFDTHLPSGHENELALITGDRSDIHLKALQRNIRLIIVTGDREIEPLIIEAAASRNVSIIKTNLDSASVIRRMKFSMPVEYYGFAEGSGSVYHCEDHLHNLRNRILAEPEDVLPVVDASGNFRGVIRKKTLSGEPPYRVILVDHNETIQSLPGIEDLPVVEVVDHHRIGMNPTTVPIKFTGDVVGSTCTLIASMYKGAGESLTKGMACLLLGGIVSDTLGLKSPTTTDLDRRMLKWLEQISGENAVALMEELSGIASALVSHTPQEIINADRKTYENGRFRFSVSQVEETNLELFRRRCGELAEAMKVISGSDKLDFAAIMITDAVRGVSELMMVGDDSVKSALPFKKTPDGIYLLPGILSRKKQLLPQLLSITGELSRN